MRPDKPPLPVDFRREGPSPRWLITGLLLAHTGACAALAHSLHVFLALTSIAALFHLGLLFRPSPLDPLRPRTVLLVSAAMHFVAWGSPAILSDDLYRYLWDGRVQLAGLNPYSLAPDAPGLEWLRDEIWPHINHREISTIYPPLAQYAFRVIAWAAYDPYAVKLVMGLASFATTALLLYMNGGSRRAATWFGLSPLVALECAGSGHLDALGVLLLTAAASLLCLRRPISGAIAVALTIGAKFLGVVLWPALVRRHGLRGLAWCLAIGVALYLPFIEIGPRLFSSLGTYATTWEFNGPIYPILEVLLDSSSAARVASALTMISVSIIAYRRNWSPIRGAAILIAILIALSPVVHPWYVLWLLPFAAILHWRWPFVLAATMPLAYEVLIGYQDAGTWSPAPWTLVAIYGPVAIAAMLEWRAAPRDSCTEQIPT